MFSIHKLTLATVARTDWTLMVPVGTTEKGLKDPDNYKELASRLSLFDLSPNEYPQIDVTDPEGNFFARVVVVSNSNQKVQTEVLYFKEVSKPKKEALEVDNEDDNAGGETDEVDPELSQDSGGVADDVEPEVETDVVETEVDKPEYSDDAFENLKEDNTELTHFVKWGGPKNKWTLVDRDTSKVLEKGLDKEGAFNAYYDYE